MTAVTPGSAAISCGSALGVASGDNDFCQRILALNAADGGAGVLIGGIRDGASVQDDEVGLGGGGASEAAGFELAFEGGAVGLGGTASEVLHVEGGHRIIVAQWRLPAPTCLAVEAQSYR